MVSCDVQLMEFLRSKHPTMAQVLEVVLGDIGGVLHSGGNATYLVHSAQLLLLKLVLSWCASSSPKLLVCMRLELLCSLVTSA